MDKDKITIWIIKATLSLVWLISVRQISYQLPGTVMTSQWVYGFASAMLMQSSMVFLLSYPLQKILVFACAHSVKVKTFVNTHWGVFDETH